MRSMTISLIALTLAGCASAPRHNAVARTDIEQVADAGLSHIGVGRLGRWLTIVAGPELSEEARRAIAAKGTVRDLRDFPDVATPAYRGLPADHLVVERIVVEGAEARFEARLGPIPTEGEGVRGCGTAYRLPLVRSGTSWKVKPGLWIIKC